MLTLERLAPPTPPARDALRELHEELQADLEPHKRRVRLQGVAALPGAPSDIDTYWMCEMMAVHIFFMVAMGYHFIYLAIDPKRRVPDRSAYIGWLRAAVVATEKPAQPNDRDYAEWLKCRCDPVG